MNMNLSMEEAIGLLESCENEVLEDTTERFYVAYKMAIEAMKLLKVAPHTINEIHNSGVWTDRESEIAANTIKGYIRNIENTGYELMGEPIDER